MSTTQKLSITPKNAKLEVSSFVYTFGDTVKTPVDFSAQTVGTRLVLVTEGGAEYEVIAGITNLQGEISPVTQAKLDRMKSWDLPGTKFPNLKVSREG